MRRGEKCPPLPPAILLQTYRSSNATCILQPEKDRMDIYHKLFLVARRDQLHQAPIPHQWEPRILDLGCGTGIWSIDMAE